ncbi:MAG: YncE family protein [candidate division Zixibacteria bacterium]|nr:YncE family protein [candidate division Zixibacteria bacterium]
MKQVLMITLGILLLSAGCNEERPSSPLRPDIGPEGFIYVLNQEDGTIWVFDSKTGAQTDSMGSLVPKPHHIEFSPDHTYFYVVGRNSPGRIAKFEHETGALVDSVTIPGDVVPTSIAVSLNGTVGWVADFTAAPNAGNLIKLNLNTMDMLSNTLQSGSGTHDVKVTNDGSKVYACNRFTDDLTIVTTSNDNVEIKSLNEADPSTPGIPKYGPYGLAIDSKDSLLYIACLDSNANQVRVWDIAADSVVDSIMIPFDNSRQAGGNFAGPTLMDLTSDDSQLWVTTQWGNSVVVIDPTTKAVLANIPFGTPMSFGVNISDDDSRAYVACVNVPGERGRVYVIDTQTFNKVDSLLVGKNPYMAHYHAGH